MITFFEIFSPSFLLFPALVGSLILGLVCPLVGTYLVLRRTIFLGLTLPQVAAAGVAFALWGQQAGLLPVVATGERTLALLGSLLFTFVGMGLLGFLEQRGRGVADGRLAAAYALAGSLTILFLVFNPFGEIEILSLLKGEVIALSVAELKILLGVFAVVFTGMLVFRREFLLSAFDRDLAFLLKGGNTRWDILFYLLAGFSIAVGVIMAGPLLVFGFLVLPPLAARPLVKSMSAFSVVSSLIGVSTAFLGFYFSVRLDLPLGPADVALGCGLLFLAHGLRKFLPRATALAAVAFGAAFLATGCAPKASVSFPTDDFVKRGPLWLASVKNTTDLPLHLPPTNPVRALRELVGQDSMESRPTVMDLLRDELVREFRHRGFQTSLPEGRDGRLTLFPSVGAGAARLARQANLSGFVLLSEIRRWSVDSRQFVSVLIDFRLVGIDDGQVLWKHRVQRAVPTLGAGHLGQAYADVVDAIVKEIFGSS